METGTLVVLGSDAVNVGQCQHLFKVVGSARKTGRPHRAGDGGHPHAAAMIAAGSPAPAFRLRCGQYRDATLEDYRGKRLVVVFYVADWHTVCTGQLLRYCQLLSELHGLGADLIAISADTLWSPAAFASANQLPFVLLSDQPRGKAARTYGVLDAERGLFVIDAYGMIAWSAVLPQAIDPGVDGILTALEVLGASNNGIRSRR